MRIFTCALCAVFLLSTAVWGHSASLTAAAEFTVPGFTRPIEKIKFNDINSDSNPEILAADGETMVLYSPSDWSTLLNIPLTDNYTDYAILFDDINRDSIPDIVLAYYFECRTILPDTACRIYVYDGASGYTLTDSAHYDAGTMVTTDRTSPFKWVTLAALDVTGDGYNELFCGFDKYRSFKLMISVMFNTIGLSFLTDDIAQPPIWEKTVLMSNPCPVFTAASDRFFATTTYSVFASVPGDVTVDGSVEIIDAYGESRLTIDETTSVTCPRDSAYSSNICSFETSGDINPIFSGTEILVRHSVQQTCFLDDMIALDSTEISLRLYNLIAPDSVEILWSVYDAPSCSEYFFSPDYPGRFYGIDGGCLYEFNGENGQPSRDRIDVTTGELFWTRYGAADTYKLVAVRNQTVTIHELDLVTDVAEQTTTLPSSFTLGPAYPNPFNPSCVIEYSLPKSCHTKIGVYNILGQKVTTLVDELKPAGNHSVEWNGTNQSGQPAASGIYLFSAEFDGSARTVKAVMLK
ncbi:MAG: FlgD immunoglobulin-like domain containing protein [Candidatus Zixiibacteriota bacterium]